MATFEETFKKRHEQSLRAMAVFDRDDKESTLGIVLSWMSIDQVEEMLTFLENR